MNKQRRTKINEALVLIDRAREILEEVRDEEQESFDNLPEGLQEGERGEQMQENIDALEEFLDNLVSANKLLIVFPSLRQHMFNSFDILLGLFGRCIEIWVSAVVVEVDQVELVNPKYFRGFSSRQGSVFDFRIHFQCL